jgi:hypothetical protein
MGTEQLNEQLSQKSYSVEEINTNSFVQEANKQLDQFLKDNQQFSLESLVDSINDESKYIMKNFLDSNLGNSIEKNMDNEILDLILLDFDEIVLGLYEPCRKVLNVILIQNILENREYLHSNHTDTLLKSNFEFQDTNSLSFIWIYTLTNKKARTD